MLSKYYIIFWLIWTGLIVGGVAFVAWRLISLLKLIHNELTKLNQANTEAFTEGIWSGLALSKLRKEGK